MTEAVLFAYNSEKSAQSARFMPGRDQLFGMLEEQGFRPVVSVGAEKAFDGDYVTVGEIAWGETPTVVPVGRLRLGDEVKVLVNRADGSLDVPGLPAMVNENATRRLGHNRDRAYEEVLGPLAISLPTSGPKTLKDLRGFLEAHPADNYLLRRKAGRPNEKPITKPKADVIGQFRDNDDWLGSYLVRPAVDTTAPFPSHIQPYHPDETSQSQFEELSTSDTPKELRQYGFYSGGKAQVFPIAKIGDRWLAVNPHTVPVETHYDAVAAIEKAAESTGAKAVFAAMSFEYGNYRDGADLEWYATDLHLRMPHLPGYEDLPRDAAETLHRLFANMLVETARGA